MYSVSMAPNITGDYISIISNVRCMLHAYIYNRPEIIENLKQCIQNYIDCLQLDYDPFEMCYTIKIKKTSLKKISGFEHSSLFYNTLILKAFHDFFTNNYNDIIVCMKQVYGTDAINVFNFLVNGNVSSCLCNIQCYGDNIVKIHV